MAFITQLSDIDDFIGLIELSDNLQDTDSFDSVVKEVENNFFRDLLGDELYIELYTDLDAPTAGSAAKTKYIDLLAGVNYTDDDGVFRVLQGADLAVRYFIFYQWTQIRPYKDTQSGSVINTNENSSVLERQQLNAVSQTRYNLGLDYYNELLRFVNNYKVYDTSYTSISEAGGTYTVLTADTLYLEVGDTVRIDSIDFEVTVLTPNTSFEFVSTTGQTFAVGGPISWEPFKDAALKKRGVIALNGLA